jgi:hypothetical protein
MSQQALEQIIGRLALDQAFREQLRANRAAALAGYDLTPAEIAGLENLDLESLSGAVRDLDERISKGRIGNI